MADDISIASRDEFEDWLRDKPPDWARVIALRSALRVFTLVFTVLDVSDTDLGHGRKQGLILGGRRQRFGRRDPAGGAYHAIKQTGFGASLVATRIDGFTLDLAGYRAG